MTGGVRLAWICCGLLLLLSAVTLGSLLVGAAPVSPGAVLDLITGRGPSQGTDRTVILAIRVPRIAAALLAGGALAVAVRAFRLSRAIRWPSPRSWACRAAPPSGWCWGRSPGSGR